MPDSSDKQINKKAYDEECAKLEYCLEIAKCAYKQEMDRQESIQSKSENIVKYSSLFVAIANLVISLVSNSVLGLNSNGTIKGLYVCLMIAIIFSIILALVAQRPAYMEMFPDGEWMFHEIKTHKVKYKYESGRIYELMLRYTSITKSLRKTNDNSLKFVIISYVLYVISIVLLTWILAITVKI